MSSTALGLSAGVGSGEKVQERSTQLAGTRPQHSKADAVQSSSFSFVGPLKLSTHLSGCDVKFILGVEVEMEMEVRLAVIGQ